VAEKRNEWFDWIKAFGIAAILAIVIRLFLFSPVIVDGPSMQPNLQNGDFLIVNKISYILGEPDRFDVVVFNATASRDYIKRVIGLPGEHVKYENETLYINGKPVEEPYLEERVESFSGTYTHDFTLEKLPGNFEEIPDGHVLVLGDNRTNSKDSRRLGLIPVDNLVGKSQIIAWPLDRIDFVRE